MAQNRGWQKSLPYPIANLGWLLCLAIFMGVTSAHSLLRLFQSGFCLLHSTKKTLPMTIREHLLMLNTTDMFQLPFPWTLCSYVKLLNIPSILKLLCPLISLTSCSPSSSCKLSNESSHSLRSFSSFPTSKFSGFHSQQESSFMLMF